MLLPSASTEETFHCCCLTSPSECTKRKNLFGSSLVVLALVASYFSSSHLQRFHHLNAVPNRFPSAFDSRLKAQRMLGPPRLQIIGPPIFPTHLLIALLSATLSPSSPVC
ncbi:unnamed protein product [Merluccius merluccius]